ncbi:hypothetical protein [Microbacterium sp.]|uniref:hypothetical protein n=1 Tax=Microbacterium sp. TaxID=51671 RepID=UPI003C152CCC
MRHDLSSASPEKSKPPPAPFDLHHDARIVVRGVDLEEVRPGSSAPRPHEVEVGAGINAGRGIRKRAFRLRCFQSCRRFRGNCEVASGGESAVVVGRVFLGCEDGQLGFLKGMPIFERRRAVDVVSLVGWGDGSQVRDVIGSLQSERTGVHPAGVVPEEFLEFVIRRCLQRSRGVVERGIHFKSSLLGLRVSVVVVGLRRAREPRMLGTQIEALVRRGEETLSVVEVLMGHDVQVDLAARFRNDVRHDDLEHFVFVRLAREEISDVEEDIADGFDPGRRSIGDRHEDRVAEPDVVRADNEIAHWFHSSR